MEQFEFFDGYSHAGSALFAHDWEFVRTLLRKAADLDLTRPREGRLLAGVSAGFARRYEINPLVARLIAITTVLVLTPLVYVLGVIHTVGSGSDAGTAWLTAVLVGTGTPILYLGILRALPPTAGNIWFRSAAGAVVDLATLDARPLRRLRAELQMIFQDPRSSLNPRLSVFDVVSEPLVVNGVTDRAVLRQQVGDLLGDKSW